MGKAIRLCIVLLIACAGCAGSGNAHLVPLMRSDLPPGESLFQHVQIHQAYYWVDSDSTLKLGLRHRAPAVIGPSLDWQMSVVLEGMPAGQERLYRLAQREVRLVQDYGGDHRRARSGIGVAVIGAPRNNRLKGRLHVNLQQQQFNILTGWSPEIYRAPMLILVAEFEAVENKIEAERILRYTESDGFERDPIQPSPEGVSSAPSQPVMDQ